MHIPYFRDKLGRFKRGWHVTKKGYPRYHCEPFRGQYVHRIKIGRKLNKDEDVHHKNGNKLDFRKSNLQVLGHTEHGYVSAKQHYYVGKVIETREKEWYKEWGLVD